MTIEFMAGTFPDILMYAEQLRAELQARLMQQTGIDFRVAITVFPTGEPRAQELVNAARELGWQYDEMLDKEDPALCYDQVYLPARAGGGITIYGPDRPRSAE